jgi:hypothetical protein
MTTIPDDNLIGFYASFMTPDSDQNLIKNYLWSEDGLKNKLSSIKWQTYGHDFHLILFQFYVKPIPALRNNLRKIENYRRKEKSIGVPIIIDEANFFSLNVIERQKFLTNTILIKIDLLREKVKRNKLDLDVSKLKEDIAKLLAD